MEEQGKETFQRLKAVVSAVSGGNQSAFANSIGLTQSTFSGYYSESGVARIKLPTLKRIHEVHKVDLVWLLTGQGEMFIGVAETAAEEQPMATPVADAIRKAEIALRRAGASEQSVWSAVQSLAKDRLGES